MTALPMTQPGLASLWERIQAFHFDTGPTTFPFWARLASENGWSMGYAARAISEYAASWPPPTRPRSCSRYALRSAVRPSHAEVEQRGTQRCWIIPKPWNPRTDRALEAICLMCLEKNPDERYRSAEGLARDLERWLSRRTTDARRLGVLGRAGLWCRRSPLGAGLLAALLALGVVSGLELADRLAAPRRARLAVAEQTAALLVSRLADITRAVEATAARPELAALLVRRDYSALQALIEEEGRQHDDLDGSSPFASLFVIDARDGAMVVRWPEADPESKGVDFRTRDYYQGLLASSGTGAYVSRVFRGVTDQLFRFGMSPRVLHENQTVGVVVATVTTDDRMGLPDVRHESVVTAVLARRDPNPLPGDVGPRQSDASEYVILVHPAYVSGIEPRWLPRRYLPQLTAGEASAYRDPVANLAGASGRRYRGTWVARFVAVTGTEFIVVVQQRLRNCYVERGPVAVPDLAMMSATDDRETSATRICLESGHLRHYRRPGGPGRH